VTRIEQDLPLPTPTGAAQELAEWWEKLAHSEVEPLLLKMTEYGGSGAAVDLIEIGRKLSELGPRLAALAADDASKAELGCYFYIVGKMARWHAALMEGRAVSDDTLHDIGVYTRMVQRIREAGGWPSA
jgi:hypothetical protein